MHSGHNTNIRHRGTLFHVQTEDSGRSNPYLVTHLFHEGSILASEKSGYEDELDKDDLADRVKSRMESQHVAMLKRLRSGVLDDEIEARLGAEIFQEAADAPAAREAAPEPRSRGRARSADAPLDELVLDYLAERGPRAR